LQAEERFHVVVQQEESEVSQGRLLLEKEERRQTTREDHMKLKVQGTEVSPGNIHPQTETYIFVRF
jgi:hypothetical protein